MVTCTPQKPHSALVEVLTITAAILLATAILAVFGAALFGQDWIGQMWTVLDGGAR